VVYDWLYACGHLLFVKNLTGMSFSKAYPGWLFSESGKTVIVSVKVFEGELELIRCNVLDNNTEV
jgi:hypothetical protein